MFEDKKTVRGGASFCELLTILFIGLKLANVISWSWWWVLGPAWIPIGIVIIWVVVNIIYMRITKACHR